MDKWKYEHDVLTAKNLEGFSHFQVLSDLEVQQLLDHLVLIRGGKPKVPGIQDNGHHATQVA